MLSHSSLEIPINATAWTEIIFLNVKNNKISEVLGDMLKFWDKVCVSFIYASLFYDISLTICWWVNCSWNGSMSAVTSCDASQRK